MNKKRINPSIGAYFKDEGRIYQAKESKDIGQCFGCHFNRLFENHHECWAPPVLCSGKIFEDVTDTIDVELVEDKKYNQVSVISVLFSGVLIFFFLIYKLIIHIIHLLA